MYIGAPINGRILEISVDYQNYAAMIGFTAFCFIFGIVSHIFIEKPLGAQVDKLINNVDFLAQ